MCVDISIHTQSQSQQTVNVSQRETLGWAKLEQVT